MKRSSFIRVLLSLLLLVSQQLAVSHAISHLTGSTDKSVNVHFDGTSKPSKPVANTHSCAHCFTSGQMASAIGSSAYVFPAVDVQWMRFASLAPAADCTSTVCVFQSRAPPQA
jgi:LPS sulfotransferase NodH